ncbi:FAD-binding oxidoreductase [Luteitalea sp.]|uniref:FAD-binding oxidoreductase n=1 Tax=Luteitalea sp. TaxID=2004800 RepID=UPI0037C840B6
MTIAARAPLGPLSDDLFDRSPDAIAAHLEDAAHYPGGTADAVARPRTETDVAAVLADGRAVLVVGAQSSLTGGATPTGAIVLSTARLTAIDAPQAHEVRVAAGVPLATLLDELARHGLDFPPVPTYLGATVGGIIATNAAGAATYKYGTTRQWVDGLTVVLAGGDVIDIRRGQHVLDASGVFLVDGPAGRREVPVPTYVMPDVVKRSAGYHAAPGMDLVDLFIGAEGTLGVITAAVLRLQPARAGLCYALVPCTDELGALALVADLRDASRATWQSHDPAGIDVAAIEHMDGRSLQILREDGADRKYEVSWPASAGLLLLIQLELPPISQDEAYDQISSALDEGGPDTPLARFCRVLDRHGVLDDTELALPGDRKRAEQLLGVREAVPAGVNARVGRAKRDIDGRIAKTAADMVVPFEKFGEMMAIYREGFARRGLDVATWGHVSDGNVHPNVLPRSYEDVEAGKAAILEFGVDVARLGGCPLAEHGVGRHPVKQALLRQLYGDEGIEQMRAVKRALDPQGILAPGVLFSA